MDRARSAGSKSSRTRTAAPNYLPRDFTVRVCDRFDARRAAARRALDESHPNIGRIDVDATESERSEVSERPPGPAVDVGAGGARASTASARGSRATGAAGPCGRPRPRRRRTRPSSGPSCPSSTSRRCATSTRGTGGATRASSAGARPSAPTRSSSACCGPTRPTTAPAASTRAAQESDMPNFKGSYLGRFPLVSADFWTRDHLSERPRSVDAFSGTRARGTLTLKRR